MNSGGQVPMPSPPSFSWPGRPSPKTNSRRTKGRCNSEAQKPGFQSTMEVSMDDQSNFSGRGEYEIKVKGHLNERLSYWFEDLTITTGYGKDGTPITTFSGPIVDQAALHGVLARIRDMNLPLISVNQVGSGAEDESQAK